MHYRKLGKTDIEVSEIGFGSWGIGGETSDGANSYGKTDDTESVRSLEKAFEKGINFIDTSNIYGYGHSEELIGQTFRDRRDKIVIASKAGFVKHGGPHDLRGSFIRECLEGTLRRLQTDYVDLYQLHSPPIDLLRDTPEAIETMLALKKEGKIRAFGISVKNPQDGVLAIREFGAEVIQVNFNMIDQRALEAGVFDEAAKAGVGVIARTPLAFGFLSGAIKSFDFSAGDHRSSWPEGQLKRWADAPDLFSFINRDPARTPTQLALQFCLGFPGVSSVIPGILHPHEAEENAAASDRSPLTAEELAAVELVYKQHTFFDPSLKK